MKRVLIFTVIILFSTVFVQAQSSKVNQYLKMAAQGKISEVKQRLPELTAQYPDEPGVKLLQAVTMDDGIKALEIYKKITKEFPNSEWADDCYWRIVQFYAIVGDTARASQELEIFRKKYPNSEFLAPAADVARLAVNSVKYDYKTKLQRKNQDLAPAAVQANNTETHIKKDTSKIKAVENNSTGKFGLQVGVYSLKATAESESKRFRSLKLRTEIKEKNIEGKIVWAVVIGEYSTIEKAESEKIFIEKKCNCNPIIYKK